MPPLPLLPLLRLAGFAVNSLNRETAPLLNGLLLLGPSARITVLARCDTAGIAVIGVTNELVAEMAAPATSRGRAAADVFTMMHRV